MTLLLTFFSVSYNSYVNFENDTTDNKIFINPLNIPPGASYDAKLVGNPNNGPGNMYNGCMGFFIMVFLISLVCNKYSNSNSSLLFICPTFIIYFSFSHNNNITLLKEKIPLTSLHF